MKRLTVFILLFTLMLPTLTYGNSTDPYRKGVIEGYVRGWIDGQIEIEEYDGTLHLLALEDKVVFEIDNRLATRDDFRVGMEVSASLRARRIYHVFSFSAQNPGYIPEGGKMRNGTVVKIDRDQIAIKLPTGEEETYFTSDSTVALRKSKTVSLEVLYVGDHVKLSFDDIETRFISRMEIQDDSVVIKDIYRGRLNLVDWYKDTLTFSEVEVFRNGKWQSLQASLKLPFTAEEPVYMNGEKIAYGNLSNYRGKTFYLAIKDYFGKNRIEKMVVKSQFETAYNGKIEDINWYSEAFELADKRNMAFNEGTMVVKSGRLVDRYALNPGSDAFIAADGRNLSLSADIIYIYNEDINNSNIGSRFIYSGRLDDVLKDRVVVESPFNLDRNEWQSYGQKKEFYYDDDTMIYDLENNSTINAEEFFSGGYSVDESSNSYKLYGKRDWNAYFYTDGDRIASILLQKPMDSLLRQRVTNGVVESVEEDPLVGWSAYLRNASDWSIQKSGWMHRSAPLRVNLKKAMIIKEGRVIKAEDLKEGDRLYLVRDDFIGKVVVVK